MSMDEFDSKYSKNKKTTKQKIRRISELDEPESETEIEIEFEKRPKDKQKNRYFQRSNGKASKNYDDAEEKSNNYEPIYSRNIKSQKPLQISKQSGSNESDNEDDIFLKTTDNLYFSNGDLISKNETVKYLGKASNNSFRRKNTGNSSTSRISESNQIRIVEAPCKPDSNRQDYTLNMTKKHISDLSRKELDEILNVIEHHEQNSPNSDKKSRSRYYYNGEELYPNGILKKYSKSNSHQNLRHYSDDDYDDVLSYSSCSFKNDKSEGYESLDEGSLHRKLEARKPKSKKIIITELKKRDNSPTRDFWIDYTDKLFVCDLTSQEIADIKAAVDHHLKKYPEAKYQKNRYFFQGEEIYPDGILTNAKRSDSSLDFHIDRNKNKSSCSLNSCNTSNTKCEDKYRREEKPLLVKEDKIIKKETSIINKEEPKSAKSKSSNNVAVIYNDEKYNDEQYRKRVISQIIDDLVIEHKKNENLKNRGSLKIIERTKVNKGGEDQDQSTKTSVVKPKGNLKSLSHKKNGSQIIREVDDINWDPEPYDLEEDIKYKQNLERVKWGNIKYY